jgi:hypothetical protein
MTFFPREALIKYLEKDGSNLKYGNESQKDDEEIVTKALQKYTEDKSPLQYASERLRNDKNIVFIAIKKDPFSFSFASNTLREDSSFIYQIIAEYYIPGILKYASEKITGNINFMYSILEIDSWTYEYSSYRLKEDIEFSLYAIRKYIPNIQYVADYLKNNEDFMCLALDISLECYEYLPECLIDNVKIKNKMNWLKY